jgi:predicted SAM-dependent methyltransferase
MRSRVLDTKERILNIGCGSETYGTDFVDWMPQRPEVKKVNLSTDKLPYSDNTFDKVYSRRVIEHIADQTHILSEARRVLKQGGRILIISANAGLYGWFTDAFWKEEPSNTWKSYSLHTSLTLKNLLEDAGFVEITSHVSNSPPTSTPKETKAKIGNLMQGIISTVPRFRSDVIVEGIKPRAGASH